MGCNLVNTFFLLACHLTHVKRQQTQKLGDNV